jgi:hypothetical protein
MKWILGLGTRLVWNLVTSSLIAQSKCREAVSELIREIGRDAGMQEIREFESDKVIKTQIWN